MPSRESGPVLDRDQHEQEQQEQDQEETAAFHRRISSTWSNAIVIDTTLVPCRVAGAA
jgi:hypothetical protein